MTDLMTRLADARPTDAELDAMWPSPDRASRFERVRRSPGRGRGRSGRRTALAAAAAAVLAVVVVPPVLDSGDAAAADLQALAIRAATYDGPVLREGAWLHERSESVQRNSSILSDGLVLDTVRETWTSWDGTVWLVEHRPSAGWTSYDVLDERFAPSYGDPTPAFAATLPDDADGLRAYLDDHVSGSNSHEEALFEALTGLATSHTLPPRTLAAAFEALAEVDGVDTEDVTVGGRPAVRVSFSRLHLSVLGTKAIVVDRETGQVLAASDVNPQSDYRATTTLSEVVSRVPDEVRAAFAAHREGVRYDASGRPLPPT